MKINIKARFKNKAFVVSAITLFVSFIYKLLAALDIVPAVSENELLELFSLVVDMLAFVGVVVDPTTKGVSDSDRAMLYYTQEGSGEVKELE